MSIFIDISKFEINLGDIEMPSWTDYKAQAQDRGALALELFVIESTPTGEVHLPDILPDHLTFQREQEIAGNLALAGPLSDSAGEQMVGAGLIILRAPSMAAARDIAESDPMHKSGARSYTLRKWLVNEGSLSISVGLSTGSAKLY